MPVQGRALIRMDDSPNPKVRTPQETEQACTDLFGVHWRDAPSARDNCYCLPAVSRPRIALWNLAALEAGRKAKGGAVPRPPMQPKISHSVCYCNFSEQMKQVEATQAYLLHKGLINTPLDGLIDAHIASSDEAQNSGYKRNPWPRLSGHFIVTTSGDSTFLEKRKQAMAMPAVLWAIFYCDEQLNLAHLKSKLEAFGKTLYPSLSMEPLDSYIQSRIHRFKVHLKRIYGPGIANLKRVPEMTRDGDQWRLLGRIYDNVCEGGAFEMAGRLVDQAKTLLERSRKGSTDGDGPGGSPGSDASR